VVEGILAEGAVLEFIQLQLFEKGGLIMLLIGVLSVIAAVIVIERLLYFRGRGADEDKLLKGLSDTLERGHLDQAKSVCDQFNTPLAALISAGIARIRERKESAKELRDYLLETASLEIPKEERFLSALGTIAHIAPLLGLLGTVTGNIRAFGVLGELGAITDPTLLSRGISEALLTTAAGIIVSIPAIIFYNFLVNKVNHRIIRLENRATELASLLVTADKAAVGAPRAIRNGNGALHAAKPAANGASHEPVSTAPVTAAPAAGHSGMVPAQPAQPAYAPHVAAPGQHQAAPAYAAQAAQPAQAAAAASRFDAVQAAPAPVPVPSPVEAIPVHAAPVPGSFGAVPPNAGPAPTPAHAVPTRVVAVPGHLEAVPAT
jgi:biopolymer transport protein ExbB